MSEAGKPDPAHVWMFTEKLLVEDEAERIEKLGAQELRAEMRAEGVDPERVPTGEELRARVLARAERQGRASAGRAPAASGRVAPAADPVAPVVPIRRPARVVFWLAAAFVAAAVVVAVVRGPQIVALLRGGHEPIGPDNELETPAMRREMAEKLRHDAFGNCEQGAWMTCRDLLDRAAQLDPAGESDPQVQQARTDIDRANKPAPEPKKPDKPGM